MNDVDFLIFRNIDRMGMLAFRKSQVFLVYSLANHNNEYVVYVGVSKGDNMSLPCKFKSKETAEQMVYEITEALRVEGNTLLQIRDDGTYEAK